MAIPNNPNWSALVNALNYQPAGIAKPPNLAFDVVQAVSLGPMQLSSSGGKLNERYWIAYVDNGAVYIKGSQGEQWGTETVLFNDLEQIKQITLTFDQLGRPLVFSRVGADTLKLYWYNPVLEQTELKVLAQGIDPNAGFDSPQDTGKSYSDAMLFYVRDDTIYMRVQRDRFEVEYETPAKLLKDLDIVSTGMRVDNRYQVVYRYEDDTYIPPPPKPPVPPGFNGDYIYMQSSATQFGLEKPLITSAQHDDISITFNIYGANKLLSTLNPTWGAYGIPIFCEGGTTTLYPIPLWYNKSIFFDILSPQYSYFRNSVRDAQLKSSRKFSLAFMYIDSSLHLTLVVNGKKYAPIMPFNLSDGRWTVAITGNTLTVLNDATTLFTMEVDRGQDGDSEPEPGRFGAYSLGPLHDMWRQNFSGALYDITATIAGVEAHYPLRTHNSATQPSVPPGNDVTIYNHKPANWKYIAG